LNKNNNLYFIPILAKAFESDEPIEVMEKALFEIKELGKHTEYRIGYEQFNGFLKSGIQSQENKGDELLEQLLVGLESNSLKIPLKEQEELKEKIKLTPTLLKKYRKIVEEHMTNTPLIIEIYKEKQLFHSALIEADREIKVSNIEPGIYSIELSNGRLLWEGELTAKDLVLGLLHPENEYSLAAETEETEVKPSRVIEMVKNEIIMNVYAGFEFGKIKIIVK